MPITAKKVVELCRQNADLIREDLVLMESGELEFRAFGADATKDQIARMRANLSRLQEIIDACGSER